MSVGAGIVIWISGVIVWLLKKVREEKGREEGINKLSNIEKISVLNEKFFSGSLLLCIL